MFCGFGGPAIIKSRSKYYEWLGSLIGHRSHAADRKEPSSLFGSQSCPEKWQLNHQDGILGTRKLQSASFLLLAWQSSHLNSPGHAPNTQTSHRGQTGLRREDHRWEAAQYHHGVNQWEDHSVILELPAGIDQVCSSCLCKPRLCWHKNRGQPSWISCFVLLR